MDTSEAEDSQNSGAGDPTTSAPTTTTDTDVDMDGIDNNSVGADTNSKQDQTEGCTTDQDPVSSTSDPMLEDLTKDDEQEHANHEGEFKAPTILPPHISSSSKPPSLSKDEGKGTEPEGTATSSTATTGKGPNKSPAELLKDSQAVIPYKEPEWASVPSSVYALDILRNGVMMGSEALTVGKTMFVVGRLPKCDIHLEHPSISRFHSVLQYGKYLLDSNFGWYVYDLGSTHGTWLNKQQIPPLQFIRIHVGHILKFGGSSRLFILTGPEDEAEEESLKTVTELKKETERRKQILEGVLDEKSEDSKAADEKKVSTQSSKKVDGISWGMGAEYGDAEEENEEQGENMDFESLKSREDYYKDDPKKALRHFFEKSGYDMNFEYTEKGTGFRRQWVCRIELPVDTATGKTLVAEVNTTGSKSAAQVQCALEACRVLDSHGVLRSGQAMDTLKQRREQELAENDFYDSDEDIFLDRTGELERKTAMRKQRLAAEKEGGEGKAETYDGLLAKLEDMEAQICSVEAELDSLTKKVETGSAEDGTSKESLETKLKKSQLRLRIVELKKNAGRVEKLAKIAKPISLPALRKMEVDATPSSSSESSADKKKKWTVMVGGMKGHRLRKTGPPQTHILLPQEEQQSLPDSTKEEEEFVEEEDDDDDDPISTTHATNNQTQKPTPTAKQDEPSRKGSALPSTHKDGPPEKKAASTSRSVAVEEPKTEGVCISKRKSEPDSSVETTSRLPTAPPTKQGRMETKKKKKQTQGPLTGDYDASDPDYAMWLPPDNQSGDGKTALNDKYGY